VIGGALTEINASRRPPSESIDRTGSIGHRKQGHHCPTEPSCTWSCPRAGGLTCFLRFGRTHNKHGTRSDVQEPMSHAPYHQSSQRCVPARAGQNQIGADITCDFSDEMSGPWSTALGDLQTRSNSLILHFGDLAVDLALELLFVDVQRIAADASPPSISSA